MKKIKLTQNRYALVDDEDFDYLNQFKWFVQSNGYAARDIGGRKDKQRVLMHRLVNQTPDNLYTDHINRDRLDNRRSNLRAVTQSINGHNCKLSKNNKSGYNGIHWYKNRWVAGIKVAYKDIYLGRYEKLEDAIKARKKAEEVYLEV